MNERIKELAAKSNFGHMENNNVVYDYRLEKFAELIAAECISVVTNLSPNYPLRYKNNLLIEINHRDQIEKVFREDCVKEIKEHFGVEE